MRSNRRPIRDLRTVAREIPGLFDPLFPALRSSFVHLLNRRAYGFEHPASITSEDFSSTSLRPSMLSEISVARAERLVAGDADPDWDLCLSVAWKRQRRHFDARVPEQITAADRAAADRVAQNLFVILNGLREDRHGGAIAVRPFIPGYEWIASSEGDFSIDSALIEVKCRQDNFGIADYRQILMYWLLSYAGAIEKNGPEWMSLMLVNPRRNRVVEFHVDEVFGLISHSASKLEVLQLFAALVEEFSLGTLGGKG